MQYANMMGHFGTSAWTVAVFQISVAVMTILSFLMFSGPLSISTASLELFKTVNDLRFKLPIELREEIDHVHTAMKELNCGRAWPGAMLT